MLLGLLGLLLLLFIGAVLAFVGYVAIAAWEIRLPARHTAGWALAQNRPSSPQEVQLPFESWQLDCPDGTCLPVWEIPADSSTDTDNPPTLIILHGWGHSRIHSLERLLAILRANTLTTGSRPFRTILIDLRGHGDAPKGATTLGEREVEDLCALIEQLGDSGVVLLGHSLGAVVAIRTAACSPETVHGVVALAPYDRLRTPIDGTLRARGLPSNFFADIIARLATSSQNSRSDAHDSARIMAQPLHIIVGENDRICSAAIAKSIAEAAPQGEFTLLENGTHGNQHECAPEIIFQSVLSMLGCAPMKAACPPKEEHAASDRPG